MGFVLTLFWGYHMFLASINQTTNERFKYDTFNAKNKARQMLREELENMGGEQNGDLIGQEEKERKSSKSKKKKKKKKLVPETPEDQWYDENGKCKNVYSDGVLNNLY